MVKKHTDTFRGIPQVSKKEMWTQPEKPPPGPTSQYNKNNFIMRGTTAVLEPVAKKVVKHPQQTALSSVNKGPQKTQKVVLPPISNGRQRTQKNQYTLCPTVCMSSQKTSRQHAIQQQAGDPMQRVQSMQNKTFPKVTCVPKDEQKVNETLPIDRPAMSPEAILKDSKLYLTEYEQKEIKDYKQVWYVGKKANKTRYLKVTPSMKSFNFGYDTEEGFYNAVINDHLAFRYQILEVLGTGYSGQVFKCMDHKTMEPVAIKVIRSKDKVHQLGIAEVKILESLKEWDKKNTAHVVHMKETFYFRNHLCITFELYEKDLYKALKDNKQRGLKEKDLRKYTTDVLKCLLMLKKKRIIHGDLKPDNLLLYTEDNEKHTAVSDFGGSYDMRHRDHPAIQTLYYMSPEMLLGKRCSTATDMWSLGCVLAELHLGHRLFRGCDHLDQFTCIMKVLGIPPVELLEEARNRDYFFYPNGVPLKFKDLLDHSTSLVDHLNSKSTSFLDFLKRCFEYDPTKRMTPEEALQHPWILDKETRSPMSAGKTESVVPVPPSDTQPASLRRKKMLPLRLQPVKKTT